MVFLLVDALRCLQHHVLDSLDPSFNICFERSVTPVSADGDADGEFGGLR